MSIVFDNVLGTVTDGTVPEDARGPLKDDSANDKATAAAPATDLARDLRLVAERKARLAAY